MRYHTDRKPDAKSRGFYWETPHDSANVVVIFPNQAGGVTVAVAEEHAMDSYNAEFECSLALPPDEALRLRDLLNGWFPASEFPPKDSSPA